MKNKIFSLFTILLITMFVLRRTTYSSYSKYILIFLIPLGVYLTYLTYNTFDKSNVVNSKTQILFKDENLQLIIGFFLIIGLILKYFNLFYWKTFLMIGVFALAFLFARRLYIHLKK
jgi:hypothetical protein